MRKIRDEHDIYFYNKIILLIKREINIILVININ